MPPPPPAAVVWFRLGLRLHDNDALLAALRDTITPPASAATASSRVLLPIFNLDPHYVHTARIGVRRWIFLLESLRDLDASLRARGSRLLVVRGDPERVMPVLWRRAGVDRMYWMWQDAHPYVTHRDRAIQTLAEAEGAQVTVTGGTVLYDCAEVIRRNGGRPPLTYQSFLGVTAKMPAPPPPAPAPDALPPVSDADVRRLVDAFAGAAAEERVGSGGEGTRKKGDGDGVFVKAAGPNGNFDVPALEEFDFERLEPGEESPHRGGESVAMKVLEAYMAQKRKVMTFEKPKTSPAAFNPADTTVLSPHLKFGTLSPRTLYHRLKAIYATGQHTQPPVSLLGQLLWRDFYYTAATGTPNYGRMAGNPICRQINWWCQDGETDDRNPIAAKHLKAWTEGRTGYPWIDAIMVQLRKEGWIHHLARHSVACFLTRGDLFISWERGAEVFEELLLDHDWSLNVGNWMWLSASAFFHQYFRVYSPVGFGKKYDKEGKFIKRYLPVLRKLPAQYIYEPWKAPKAVLKTAGVELGVNYPRPIVDHDVVSKVNMGRMKEAYDKHNDSGPMEEGSEDEERVAAGKAAASATKQKGKRKQAAERTIDEFVTKTKRKK
ncbi:FAD binding domain of DNA photolyase-domain-containing protein [Zopfochytrium polystomum]|nr:FAD binding domain of DNA photolyase-domain-containing protein [Zopfochytrium polystomum]